MNSITLIGRLTADPELSTSRDKKTTFCNFTVAVNRIGKDDEADFIRCKAFNGCAEAIAKFFVKGKPIAIEGHLRVDTVQDNNDEYKTYTSVNVDRWEFILSDPTHEAEPPKRGRR